MEPFINWKRKDKVVFVMGATGTGKSKLSIELATRFPAEVVNSDKMQIYKGLDVTTNKVTEEECRGIPHHLLGIVDPDEDFTVFDFQHHANLAVESILRKGRLPIIAGGSNSYIKALVNDNAEFQSKYDCCFLWVDVSMPVLHSVVSERVNKMVEFGLIEEIREFYRPDGDYTRGIRRAIGVPELDRYFRVENELIEDEETKKFLLREGIEEIKSNTCKLACCQLRKILKLQDHYGWNLHHLDATEVFLKKGPDCDEAWERLVARPSTMIVGHFLEQEVHEFVVPSHHPVHHHHHLSSSTTSPPPPSSVLGTAMAAATH